MVKIHLIRLSRDFFDIFFKMMVTVVYGGVLVAMATTQAFAGTYGEPYLRGERTQSDAQYRYPGVYTENQQYHNHSRADRDNRDNNNREEQGEEPQDSYHPSRGNTEETQASVPPSTAIEEGKHLRTEQDDTEEDGYLKIQREIPQEPDYTNYPTLSADPTPESPQRNSPINHPEQRIISKEIAEPPQDNSEEASYTQRKAENPNQIRSTSKEQPAQGRFEETVEKPPQQVSQVYTRTIVRPVSYSFISANVRPSVHRTTQQTTHFISEKREDENIRIPSQHENDQQVEEEAEEDAAEESQQRFSVGERESGQPTTVFETERWFLGRKTVLPGNLLDLQHKDYEELVPAVKSYASKCLLFHKKNVTM